MSAHPERPGSYSVHGEELTWRGTETADDVKHDVMIGAFDVDDHEQHDDDRDDDQDGDADNPVE